MASSFVGFQHGLILNGACIAIQYNLAANGRTYAYLAGFDPAWRRLSAILLEWGAQDTFTYRLVLRRSGG